MIYLLKPKPKGRSWVPGARRHEVRGDRLYVWWGNGTVASYAAGEWQRVKRLPELDQMVADAEDDDLYTRTDGPAPSTR